MANKFLIVFVIAIAIAGFWFWRQDNSGYSVPVLEQAPETRAGESIYRNDQYRFLITVPEGFEAREIGSEMGTTVVIEGNKERARGNKAEGVQILISPLNLAEDIYELTLNHIKTDLPDISISDPEPVEIGSIHKGLAFISDNPAFGGRSREVWFIYNKTLYQISTYDYSDSLLTQIFGTWKFY